jgi:hypothetical protein
MAASDFLAGISVNTGRTLFYKGFFIGPIKCPNWPESLKIFYLTSALHFNICLTRLKSPRGPCVALARAPPENRSDRFCPRIGKTALLAGILRRALSQN